MNTNRERVAERELVNMNQGGSEREGGHANKKGKGLGWVVSAFGQHSHFFHSFSNKNG